MTQMVIINGNERALSTDVNLLQELITQRLAQISQSRIGLRDPDPGEDGQLRSAFDGCSVQGTGVADVLQINPGVLYQYSLTWPAAPGANESATRLGLQLAAAAVPGVPVPGGNTYYLLEARVLDQVTDTQIRQIYDPGTQTFGPQLVDKERQVSIEFQWVAGDATNIPLPSGDPWVPLAGVFRPSGGGAITADQIWDLRLLGNDVGTWMVDDSVHAFDSSYGALTAAGSSTAAIVNGQFQGTVRGLGVGLNGGFTPGVDGALVPGDFESHFLCTVTGNGFRLVPRNAPALGIDQQGVLVRTPIGSNILDRANAFAIGTVPAPFGNYSCPAGDAILVGGTINVDPVNFQGFEQDTGGTCRLNEQLSVASAVSAAVPATLTSDFRTKVPRCARLMRWKPSVQGTLGAGAPGVSLTTAVRLNGTVGPDIRTAETRGNDLFTVSHEPTFETAAQGANVDDYRHLDIITTATVAGEVTQEAFLLGWSL